MRVIRTSFALVEQQIATRAHNTLRINDGVHNFILTKNRSDPQIGLASLNHAANLSGLVRGFIAESGRRPSAAAS